MPFDFEEYIENIEKKAAKNDIGKMIASGIGVGIDENSYLAITAMENVYVELETLTKNAAKNAEKLAKKTQERELKNLKNALELEFISEQEYYEKLKKYRDENLREGSDNWYKYTEEIIRYNKRLSEEAEKEQLRMMKTVKELQAELENNLKTDDGPWFSSLRVILKGAGLGGGDEAFTWNKLEDFQGEIDELQRYRQAILSLKELGNIPDGVFSDIAQMDVSEGLLAANTILSASDEVRERFIKGYNTRNSLAGSIAGELNGVLNKEALAEAGIYSAEVFNSGYFKADSEEKTAFVKELEKSFKEIPQSYYDLGISSGEAFGQGFESQLVVVMAEAREYMLSAMSQLVSEVTARVSGEGADFKSGTSNTYNTSYTFNSSRDTTTVQLQAARNAATLERLRGGN